MKDTDKLKSHLQKPLSEIYAKFPGRPKASVNAKAEALGRKRLRRKGHTYKHGYKTILSRGGKKAWEHRRVAEEKIGRPLQRKEVVHHINYIRHDNRPENLDVLESRSVHAKIARSVNGLVRCLLDGGEIGYDPGAHSYFFRSRSFGPAGGGRAVRASHGRWPELSYVFCGDRIFPFPMWTDMGLSETLAELSHAKSVLPMEGRHAVVLCGVAASPALLEGALGAGASPFPVVKGWIGDYGVVPVRGAAGLVRDALEPSSGASAAVWAALLDSRQLGAMDACAGRGRLCDLVEVPAPVRFGNGEGLSVAHAYAPRRGPSPAHGFRPVRGSPPQLSRVLTPLVSSRAKRRAA